MNNRRSTSVWLRKLKYCCCCCCKMLPLFCSLCLAFARSGFFSAAQKLHTRTHRQEKSFSFSLPSLTLSVHKNTPRALSKLTRVIKQLTRPLAISVTYTHSHSLTWELNWANSSHLGKFGTGKKKQLLLLLLLQETRSAKKANVIQISSVWAKLFYSLNAYFGFSDSSKVRQIFGSTLFYLAAKCKQLFFLFSLSVFFLSFSINLVDNYQLCV